MYTLTNLHLFISWEVMVVPWEVDFSACYLITCVYMYTAIAVQCDVFMLCCRHSCSSIHQDILTWKLCAAMLKRVSEQ